jgi:hypothetical protein
MMMGGSPWSAMTQRPWFQQMMQRQGSGMPSWMNRFQNPQGAPPSWSNPGRGYAIPLAQALQPPANPPPTGLMGSLAGLPPNPPAAGLGASGPPPNPPAAMMRQPLVNMPATMLSNPPANPPTLGGGGTMPLVEPAPTSEPQLTGSMTGGSPATPPATSIQNSQPTGMSGSLVSGGGMSALTKPYKHGGRVEPTDGQKKAGNYKKRHISVHGLDISIENERGSTRSGVGKDGKPWSVKMPAPYGYIRRTEGADGDHVDCYIGPHIKSPHVWVVDQHDAGSKRFDEHKCFLGFASEQQVRRTYEAAFSDGKGKTRIGRIRQMTVDGFKHWLKHGELAKRAV